MDPHTRKLIEAAESRGITWKDLGPEWKTDAILLSHRGHSELIFGGRVYAQLSHHTDLIADNKHISKLLLNDIGIRTPRSILFENPQQEAGILQQFMEGGTTFVCKPLAGTEGHAIAMNIRHLPAILEHHRLYADQYQVWMLEEQITGSDLRIQAIGGKLVAACIREPAHVIGDGHSSLEKLIDQRRAVMAQENPENRLDFDLETQAILKEQNLQLNSVPLVNQRVELKYVSNMSLGGIATDVTDEIHIEYHLWIEKIAKLLNLSIFAVDLLTEDFTHPPANATYALEINVKPQWLHHTFSRKRTHEIASLILDDFFGPV